MSEVKKFMTGFKKGQRVFGETIGIIVNSVLLTIVYVSAVGLTSIAAKISGKHFLETKIDEKSGSYWTDLNLGKKPMEEYHRQL